jgi:glutamate synthase domain-containing protein 2
VYLLTCSVFTLFVTCLIPCRAIGVGILKVMAKMGISTLASYKGAQIFEVRGTLAAVGAAAAAAAAVEHLK